MSALLAVVVLASGNGGSLRGGGEGRGVEMPSVLLDYAVTALLLLMPLGAVLFVWAFLSERPMRRRRSQASSSLRLLVWITAISLAAALLAQYLAQRGGPVEAPALSLPDLPAGRESAGTGDDSDAYAPRFSWSAAALLGALALVAVAVTAVLARRRRRGPSAERLLREELGSVIDDTLDDLRRERDPRRAVIAAYARMETALARSGLPRRPSEAPLEYLARVLTGLRAGTAAIRELTRLFERAKFSRHEIDSTMQEQAIAALVGVRAGLETPA